MTYHVIDKERFDEKNDSLRKTIENDFLGNILKEAQDERSDTTSSRACLFCKKVFEKNLAPLFDHLHHDHNLFLGHYLNIINANELLDVLEEKLKQLQCLYCEKTFTTWNVLKEHMRKKGHKMLNPNNREYDKFYLINYLCSDKNWKQIKQVRLHIFVAKLKLTLFFRRMTFTTKSGTTGWRRTKSKTVFASFALTSASSTMSSSTCERCITLTFLSSPRWRIFMTASKWSTLFGNVSSPTSASTVIANSQPFNYWRSTLPFPGILPLRRQKICSISPSITFQRTKMMAFFSSLMSFLKRKR